MIYNSFKKKEACQHLSCAVLNTFRGQLRKVQKGERTYLTFQLSMLAEKNCTFKQVTVKTTNNLKQLAKQRLFLHQQLCAQTAHQAQNKSQKSHLLA